MGFEGKRIVGDRCEERIPLDAATRLRPNDWSSLEVRILDLSRFGFQATCEARMLRGTIVTVDLPGIGSVSARVKWQRQSRFGAEFTDPIEIDLCTWTAGRRGSFLACLLSIETAARSLADEERSMRQELTKLVPASSR